MTMKIVIEEENFYDILESKIYNASDKEFIDFIEKEFYQLKSLQVNKYKNNLKQLKLMDPELFSTVIARLAYLEESKDALKSMTFFSGITFLVISAYMGFVETTIPGFEKVSPAVSFISILCLYGIFTYLLGNSRREKSLVIYFRNLVKS